MSDYRLAGGSGVPYDGKEVMTAKVVHAIWFLAGALLLYAGLFLTETEEGRLRNRLEELWIRVDDLRSKAMNLQAALLRQTAGLVADGFTIHDRTSAMHSGGSTGDRPSNLLPSVHT